MCVRERDRVDVGVGVGERERMCACVCLSVCLCGCGCGCVCKVMMYDVVAVRGMGDASMCHQCVVLGGDVGVMCVCMWYRFPHEL